MKEVSDKIGQELSYYLRHDPDKINLKLDTQGYGDVQIILDAMHLTKEELDEIVRKDAKQRYSYNVDQTKIRANQGHSLSYVKIDYDLYKTPGCVYHGTCIDNLKSIMKSGLKPRSRNYVHLSRDLDTATIVGMRHAKKKDRLLLLKIDADQMRFDGMKLYISDNKVVLADSVPAKYIMVVN